MMDGESHKLLDILENRQFSYLERYFTLFSLQNALLQDYSNGLLECLNNHIKVSKRNV